MDNALQSLIESILNSDVYCNYAKELERIKQYPELKSKVDEYRTRNFEIQTDKNAAFEKIQQFEREYSDFCDNEVVADFLAAELDLCRMVQEIHLGITKALQFE